MTYPIYIPSRGRAGLLILPKLLKEAGLKFLFAVEPQDAPEYRKHYGAGSVIVMDKNDQGVAYARNFIKQFSISKKEKFHWQFDDNIKSFQILNGKKYKSSPLHNISILEGFMNEHKNISHIGMAYCTFAFGEKKEYTVNKSPASGFLVNNSVELWYRKGVPVDIDYTLQALKKGWCTVVFERVLIEKPGPLQMKGGCTEIEYGGQKRLERTMKLKEYWPDYVDVKYKYGRYGLRVKQLGKLFPTKPVKK